MKPHWWGERAVGFIPVMSRVGGRALKKRSAFLPQKYIQVAEGAFKAIQRGTAGGSGLAGRKDGLLYDL